VSPSEEQLRRALREGESAGPDVDDVVTRAVAFRRARRTKIASTVAVVAVVAGVGTGVGVLGSGGGTDHRNSSLDSRPAERYGGAPGSNSVGKASSDAADDAGGGAAAPVAAPTPCPAALPRIAFSPATSAALFATPVAELTVCGYLGTGAVVRDASTQQPLAHTYSGKQATTIATAANAAATKSTTVGCGAIAASTVHSLLLLAKDTTGTALPPVLVGVGACDKSLSNGSSTRYDWQEPSDLTPFVRELQAAASAQASVPAPSTS